MHRQYDFNGLAGCVEQRRSRETGLLVGLYHAEQAGMDPEAGAWVTVCEVHGQLVNHETLALARSHLANPTGWCEVCNGTEPDNGMAGGEPPPHGCGHMQGRGAA